MNKRRALKVFWWWWLPLNVAGVAFFLHVDSPVGAAMHFGGAVAAAFGILHTWKW